MLRGGTDVAYNGWRESLRVVLPDPGAGRVWRRAIDTTAWMEPMANYQPLEEAEPIEGMIYDVAGRSAAPFVADVAM